MSGTTSDHVFDPKKHHRRSIRLKAYDYAAAGAYFVTACAHHRACIFGSVHEASMHLSALGEIVVAGWYDLPSHFPNVELDAFVVMPNHVHGIILLSAPIVRVPDGGDGRTTTATAPSSSARHASLPDVVRAFKSFTAKPMNQRCGTTGVPRWQRNYYEHVIRDERSLDRIREYILGNPAQWSVDRENPAAINPERKDAWRPPRP